MQLLILNANSIIWGVDKSLNWNHMKKHFEKKKTFLQAVGEMALVNRNTIAKWKNLLFKDAACCSN